MSELPDDPKAQAPDDRSAVPEGSNANGGSKLIELLRPESLLFVSPGLADTDPQLREALAVKVRSAPDPERRLEHLHYLLGLLHDARAIDEGRFLREVFLPWVAVRDRTRPHAIRIYRELAQLSQLAPGTTDDVAHVVNVYRNIIADLLDPYATLIVASYQVLKGTFTTLVDANLVQGERNKIEYVEARMRERGEAIDLFVGYESCRPQRSLPYGLRGGRVRNRLGAFPEHQTRAAPRRPDGALDAR